MAFALYTVRSVLPTDLGHKIFSERLKRWLEVREITPYAASKQLGKSKNWVSQLIRGEFRPSVNDMAILASLLRLNGAELEEFTESAYLSHTPNWITVRYLRYQRRKSNA
jgi:transcriptional regulator with XRE-family HTH domain